MSEKVIIFGVGQIAELAHYYLTHNSDYEVVAFTLDAEFKKEDSFKNLPVIDFEQIEKHFSPNDFKMFAPISFRKMNKVRKEKYEQGKAKEYKFISYVSPKVTSYNTEIGENCFIFEDNTIQPFSKIGNNVIMWSGNHLGHHSVIQDHAFITSHVVISGAVTVGESSFIGVNSTIRDNITIGKECMIGAASIVLKDLPDFSVISPGGTEISKVPSTKLRSI